MANTNSRAFPKGLREIRYPSNDIIQRFVSRDYVGYLRLNNDTGLFEFDPPLEGTGASSGTTFTVSQAGHGFTIGQPIYHDGSTFKLANATAAETLALWVVVATPSVDSFTAAQSGRFEIADHGLIAGQFYFVNETDGGLTPTEPGTYSNPIIFVESTSIIHVLPYRPSSTTSSGGGGGDVTSVFGRTGVVVAESGDYTKDQVGLGNVLNVEQIPASDKGAANGVAELGSDGKVPASQLPAAVAGGIDIIGFWDANTNTPDLSLLTLQQGQAYQVSVAGTTDLNGINSWALYDLAVWDNSITGNWFKLTSAGQVTSVNGQTGNVVLDTDDISEGTNEYYTEAKVSANSSVVSNTAKVSADGSIDTHSDVDITTIAPAIGQTLEWDGSKFIPGTLSSPVTSVNSQVGVVILDADDINDTSTTNKFTTQTDIDKLAGIENNAEVNNITDVNATDLTDGTDSTLHFHLSDRARSGHTGTQPASTISDFDTEVSNNTSVAANTAKVSADGSIGTHSDVNMNDPSPSNGEVLTWNSTLGYWRPATITGTLPGGSQGDILYYNGSGWLTLPASTPGYLLSTNGSGSAPSWVESSIKTSDLLDLQLQFDTSITATDPTTGKFRLNNSTQGSSTELYISETEYDNGNIGDFLTALSEDSVIGLKVIGDRSKWANYKIVSVTDNTGWWTVTMTVENKGNDFALNDIVGVNLLGVGGGANEIPIVPTGERIVSKDSTGVVHVDTEAIEQYPPLGTLPSQDFSTGQATYTGIKGQVAYDSTYKYECVATDTWIRSILTKGIIDLYLTPDIDDSVGAKTSAELDTAYPSALIGQRVWGTTLFVYEKKAPNIWRKTSSTTA